MMHGAMDTGSAPCSRDPRCSKSSGHRGICNVRDNPTRLLPTGIHCPTPSPLPPAFHAGGGCPRDPRCPRAAGHPGHCKLKGEEDPSVAPAAAAGPATAALAAAALAPPGSGTDIVVEAVMVSVADIACELCGSGENDESVLLCDECNRGFHMECLAPPLTSIPEGDWHCPDCQPSRCLKDPRCPRPADHRGVCKLGAPAKRAGKSPSSLSASSLAGRSPAHQSRMRQPSTASKRPRHQSGVAAAKRVKCSDSDGDGDGKAAGSGSGGEWVGGSDEAAEEEASDTPDNESNDAGEGPGECEVQGCAPSRHTTRGGGGRGSGRRAGPAACTLECCTHCTLRAHSVHTACTLRALRARCVYTAAGAPSRLLQRPRRGPRGRRRRSRPGQGSRLPCCRSSASPRRQTRPSTRWNGRLRMRRRRPLPCRAMSPKRPPYELKARAPHQQLQPPPSFCT